MTTLSVTPDGLSAIGPVAVTLAQAEGLAAHAEAVTARLQV
ncbi:MAG TPA: histidinol dehydrogenase [bacterium]|nr:histidinol dehydrogenase [bacterium]